jgi:hypothetical protein
LLLISCKKSKEPSSFKGFVLGLNEMEPAQQGTEPITEDFLKSVVSLVSADSVNKKFHYCTGMIVQQENATTDWYVLTNAHCFAGDTGKKTEIQSWACSQTKIFSNHQKSRPDSYQGFLCVDGSLRVDFEADLAVLKLKTWDKHPSDFAELRSAKLATKSAVAGTKAFLIHYPVITESMSQLTDLKIPVPVAMVSHKDCDVIPKQDIARSASESFPYDIAHRCDIISGSSGAPLFDAASGQIIGVNWGGIDWSIDGKSSGQENRAIVSGYAAAFFAQTLEDYKRTTSPPQEVLQPENTDDEPTQKEKVQEVGRVAGCVAKPY